MSYGTEIGYLTEMGSLNYPFVNQIVPEPLRGQISDMVIVLDRKEAPTDDFKVLIDAIDIGSSGTLNSITIKYTSNSGSGTLFWGSPSNNSSWGTYRISNILDSSSTLRAKLVINMASPTYSGSSLALEVSSRCVEVRPLRCDSITATDTETTTAYTFKVEDVKFAAGYNITLTPNAIDAFDVQLASPTTQSTSITLDCIPGAGLGKFPASCDEELLVRAINSQPADKFGNFTLTAKDCYWLEKLVHFAGTPPASNPRKGTAPVAELKFHNDCVACATCDDYYREYEKLTQIRNRAGALYDRLMAAIKKYEYYLSLVTTIKAYLEQPTCTFSVTKVNSNLYTLKVVLYTGGSDIGMLNVGVSYPAAYTGSAKSNSGWIKHGSRTFRTYYVDTTPTTNHTISYPATTPAKTYFPKHTSANWQWSVYLTPPTSSPVGLRTDADVEFVATISAQDTSGAAVITNTVNHWTTITY